MIDKIDYSKDIIQGIIIAPTRELAIQVSEELYKIGYGKRARVLSIYGGQDINRQIRALKTTSSYYRWDTWTPLDHINRKTIRLDHVQMVVLDEADEMLNMGFIEDIESILAKFQKSIKLYFSQQRCQRPIQRIAERFMHDPQMFV